MKQTFKTILTVLLAATLLFSVAYAYSSAEQDFLSFFFDEQQVEALQNYQKKYTANEFLALKLTGKLPALPDAQPTSEPAPAVEEEEQPVVEDEIIPSSIMEQSFLNEEDKLIAAEAVVDVVE